MKKLKYLSILITVVLSIFVTQTSTVHAGTDPYWESQKRLTKMVYGPFFAYRNKSQLDNWAAKIPGSFENKVRTAVLNKYGTIRSGKTYRVRWYQKVSPAGRYGMAQNGQYVGFYCEN